MSDFDKLYFKIVNKPLTLIFNQYFSFEFYVQKKGQCSINIFDVQQKNCDKLYVKCRKLSTQNWDIVADQQSNETKEKLLLMFSLVQTNFVDVKFDENGFVTLDTINQLLTLNFRIIKKIIKKIQNFYDEKQDAQYRSSITSQFKRLYSSDKGVKLKHKQIGQYLNYCGFWQKLGLNYFQVRQLPHDVYKQFVMMMNIQLQVKNAEIQKINNRIKHR